MKNTCAKRLYNIIFPVYLLLYLPNPLWIIAIPLNYAVDWLVLKFGLKRENVFEDRTSEKQFLHQTVWRICAAGFASDIIGSLILILREYLLFFLPKEILHDINQAVYISPFRSAAGLLTFLAAILIAGICIFLFDRKILEKQGLSAREAKRIAILLAVLTAPYLMLVPTNLFY